MPIATNCPHCDRAYKLADTTAGKNVRCKDCGEPFVVAAAGAPPKRQLPPRTTRAAPEPAGEEIQDVVAADEDEIADEVERPVRQAKALKRPAKPRKKGGRSVVLLLVLGGGALALLMLCVGGAGALYLSGALGTAPV
jgi:hypothetical protein